MDRRALENCFSQDQIEALIENFASRPHEHTIDEIDGLQEELDDIADCDVDDDEPD